MAGTLLFGRRRGHLRGHGGACGGRLVALATTLTPQTSQSDTLTNAYKVALCVHLQETNAADAKTVLRCCWRRRRISSCFGGFARRWRRRYASGRTKMHIFSTPIHSRHSFNLLSRVHMPHGASTSSQRPQNTPKSACCASSIVAPTFHQPRFSPARAHATPLHRR